MIEKFKFESGVCVGTPEALLMLGHSGAMRLIVRHLSGDYGDLCEEDRQLNEDAIKDGSRILSKYTVGTIGDYYVITEAVGDDGKRAATTVLKTEEY